MQNKNREFILIEKKAEADEVASLFLKPVDGLDYKFISGQYVNIKPPKNSGHSKSYTISSSPDEKLVRITIKRKGKVSSELIDLNIGGKLFLDGPYGYFYPDLSSQSEDLNNDIVMIAGGIGITPFKSIIKDFINKNQKVNVALFYSNKNIKDITFFEKLNEIAKNNSHPSAVNARAGQTGIKIVHLLTQDDTKNNFIKEYSRIDKNILKKYLKNFENKNYFICGSIDFVNSMWKILKDEGVDELNIFTEAFF